MNKQELKDIIIDQKQTYLEHDYIKREFNLEKNINYCLVGIRKCGKSYLMVQFIHELIESGIDMNQICYLNFEDERLLEFTQKDLNVVLEIALEFAGNKEPYLFFDEIQDITGWAKFARRLADLKYHVNITGSNSKMLSREIASTLGGRYMTIDVYPYSFEEFLKANNQEIDCSNISTKTRASISSLFNTYLTCGGFPELINIINKKTYLNNIYQTIYLGDIVTRNSLENSFALRLIIKKVAESIMKPISYSRIYGIVKSSGYMIGKQTVINYINYSLDSLLLFKIENYAAKLVEKETSPKYYFMDSGLVGLFGTSNKLSAQLENVVAVELIRRYGNENVFYFETNNEVDFYLPEKDIAIQVCYKLSSSDDTYKRETEALIKLKAYYSNTNCLILTIDEEDTIDIKGTEIIVMPVWKWLLAK